MKVALYDMDNTKYPNLALMKISAYYKSLGDSVDWHSKDDCYDLIFASKVFKFTKLEEVEGNVRYGGSGFSLKTKLTPAMEHTCPDYSLYGLDYSLGFSTRGCIRNCHFCIVPQKEGGIKAHAPINEFLRHDKLVLMDNNILACEHGIGQFEEIKRLGVKVDVNQGLDPRLIDNTIAKILSKVKWLKPIRLACDSHSSMKHIQRAVTLLRWHNTTPSRYMCYALIDDPGESLERIKFLKGLYLDIHAQPLREYESTTGPTQEQRKIARWVNHKAIFKSVSYEDYKK